MWVRTALVGLKTGQKIEIRSSDSFTIFDDEVCIEACLCFVVDVRVCVYEQSHRELWSE